MRHDQDVDWRGGGVVKGARKEKLFDVVAVNLKTDKVRFIAQGKTLKNAEAIVKMAVVRRGVDEEFFAEVKAGMYTEGDKWNGEE